MKLFIPFLQSKHTLSQLPLGPSPWYFVNQQIQVQGDVYRFISTAFEYSQLAGQTSLQSSTGSTLLVFDYYYYARILDDGMVLLWRETGNKITFDCFSLFSLMPIADPLAAARIIRENKAGCSPLPFSQHWEISSHQPAGQQLPVDIPYNWTSFVETLVLANFSEAGELKGMTRAIYVFDWRKRQVEIFPQDWFNQGTYDFGYQWITRVARKSDGAIIGDGIRLRSFELDKTNRQVKKWLRLNPFYRF